MFCLATGGVDVNGKYLRVTLKQRVSTDSKRIMITTVSAWDLKGRMENVSNGTANLRRSPRANERKGKQEHVHALKGKGGEAYSSDATLFLRILEGHALDSLFH